MPARVFCAVCFAVLWTAFSIPALAGPEAFETGPVFDDFGPAAAVDITTDLPPDAEFKIAYDTSRAAEAGEINRTFVTAARFINMHVRAGVPLANIDLAIIVHGKASFDAATTQLPGGAETTADGAADTDPNSAALAALIDKGVRVIVCGQSAAHYDIAADDLYPGVEMALSAMTAHALLQQDGYTLNPF